MVVEQRGIDSITDVNELFSALNEYAIALAKSEDGRKAIPHLILSHGFMKWLQLLEGQFSSLRWRGSDEEIEEGITLGDARQVFHKFFFDRFFARLSWMSAFHWLNKEEKRQLKEQGWMAYLED